MELALAGRAVLVVPPGPTGGGEATPLIFPPGHWLPSRSTGSLPKACTLPPGSSTRMPCSKIWNFTCPLFIASEICGSFASHPSGHSRVGLSPSAPDSGSPSTDAVPVLPDRYWVSPYARAISPDTSKLTQVALRMAALSSAGFSGTGLRTCG